jgi:CTD kinase subunit gamma
LSSLGSRKTVPDDTPDRSVSARFPLPTTSLSRSDIFKRIEEDRERHKRLRERRWVQPISHNPSNYLPPLMSFMPLTDDDDGEMQLAIDIEFENEWETTSDWNEDDDDAAAEGNDLCFPTAPESPMDVS